MLKELSVDLEGKLGKGPAVWAVGLCFFEKIEIPSSGHVTLCDSIMICQCHRYCFINTWILFYKHVDIHVMKVNGIFFLVSETKKMNFITVDIDYIS
jgi:hypothetical protein